MSYDGIHSKLRNDPPIPLKGNAHCLRLSTRATLVTLETETSSTGTKKFPKSESVTQITVLGSGSDTVAYGTELTRRINKLLLSKVLQKLKEGLIDRSFAKISKEAEHAKAILSVNTDVNTGVEGLVGDSGWKSKLERRGFGKAGVGLADVQSVILYGGNTRAPFLQTVLKSAVGSAKIATNVNADEAAVLEAAFYGASLSKQYKTKAIEVADAVVCDVVSNYVAEGRGKD
ncbi:lumenal Hsp70 protein, partial [Ceratobasidium sp. 392]